jgi:hypothetical protein
MSRRDRERIAAEAAAAAWVAHVKATLYPKLRDSALFLALVPDEPDPQVCLQLGAAIFYDKPILLVCPRGRSIPPGLRRIAHAIVEDVDLEREAGQAAIQQAIERLLPNGRPPPKEE